MANEFNSKEEFNSALDKALYTDVVTTQSKSITPAELNLLNSLVENDEYQTIALEKLQEACRDASRAIFAIASGETEGIEGALYQDQIDMAVRNWTTAQLNLIKVFRQVDMTELTKLLAIAGKWPVADLKTAVFPTLHSAIAYLHSEAKNIGFRDAGMYWEAFSNGAKQFVEFSNVVGVEKGRPRRFKKESDDFYTLPDTQRGVTAIKRRRPRIRNYESKQLTLAEEKEVVERSKERLVAYYAAKDAEHLAWIKRFYGENSVEYISHLNKN